MRSSLGKTAITLAVLSAIAGAAHAEGVDVRFSGFGTVAATYGDTKLADYRSSWRQDTGSRGDVDFGVDSRLGGQVNVTFNPTFSAAGQLLAIRRDGKDKVDVEWLYGQAQVTSELSIRLGRLALPAFMLSDVRNVGFAQHWAHTPAEAYLGYPVTSVDGAQLLYRTKLEGFKFTVQPTYGSTKATSYFDAGPFLPQLIGGQTFRKLRSLNVSVEKNDWTVRFGQTVANAGLVYENATFIPSDYFKDTFTSAGLQYDNGTVLLMSEFVDRKTSNDKFDTRSYYVSGGYRFGQFMPYATYSYLKNYGTIIAGDPPSKTKAVGVRWDATPSIAVKGQFERSSLSGQQFTRLDMTANKQDSAKVFTLGVDFIF